MSARASSPGSYRRRDLIKLGATAAAAALSPSIGRRVASAQTPKRGGVVSIRAWDPPHFDPHLTISYKTHIAYSFTRSRLLKYKAGPSVPPGVFPLEADLAESWAQPSDTSYVFKLRKGVRWHAKPPVNGREVTADDVVYSVERFRTVKGTPTPTCSRRSTAWRRSTNTRCALR
jgi:peptide/nickel transport system substrate-binding protein